MALNSTVLSALIKSKVEAATGHAMPAVSQGVWGAVAAAIIEHLITSGQVTVTVASVSGVTTGVGVSGPGIGTGVIS